jgi:hypothetical protein
MNNRPPACLVLPKVALGTSPETTEATTTLTLATLHLLDGGGGVDSGIEVIDGGDDVDEEILQLRLPLPLCRYLSLPAAALRDQLEDAGRASSATKSSGSILEPAGRDRGGVASTSMLAQDTRARVRRAHR